jgi:hypothetical protein
MMKSRLVISMFMSAAFCAPVMSGEQDCLADANNDGIVNVDDLLEVLSHWGPCDVPCSGDFDGSGNVDVSDLLSVIKSWGPCETDEVLLVFAQDLEHRIPGPYDESMLDEDWNEPTWSQGVDDGRVSIVETDNGANRALAVLYPEGEYGTSATGAQWKLMFDESHDCVRLSYRLQFVDSFDFVRGGKLPGLIGGEGNTGGGIPDGTDGWSARMMWRSEGAIVQYVYHPDQPESYGEDFSWSHGGTPQFFQRGRWYEVVHEIQVNTPGLNDGSITAWLDGERALEAEGMRFRDVDDFAIDGMYFSTFFGGSNSSWAATADETILFDDFVIESIGAASP